MDIGAPMRMPEPEGKNINHVVQYNKAKEFDIEPGTLEIEAVC